MSPLALFRAMRPHQWVKNVFVLAALFFTWEAKRQAGELGESVTQTLLALLAFCLGSSAIYLVNDVLDVESDRQHPEKCKRPIAAGEIGIRVAIAASISCFASALVLGALASTDAGSVTLVRGELEVTPGEGREMTVVPGKGGGELDSDAHKGAVPE